MGFKRFIKSNLFEGFVIQSDAMVNSRINSIISCGNFILLPNWQKSTICILYVLCILFVSHITSNDCSPKKKKKTKNVLNRQSIPLKTNILHENGKQTNKTRWTKPLTTTHEQTDTHTHIKCVHWLTQTHTRTHSQMLNCKWNKSTQVFILIYLSYDDSAQSKLKSSNIWNWFQKWLRKGFGRFYSDTLNNMP